MRCAVTGGAGFIGSSLAEELLNQGHEVVIIDDLSTGNHANIKGFKGKLNFIKGSILDFDLLKNSFKGCEAIFHEAAIPSVTRSILNPRLTSEVNIQGTINVLLAAKNNNVRKVIFASSSSVYGDTEELPKKESMQPKPKSPYALSKLTAEQYCKMFYSLFNLEIVCLRYFNVFGPRQDPSSEYSAVIPKFINAIMKKKSPIIFGDGTQTRDFTYVRDVVKANILAFKSKVKDGKVINIACNENISINDLAASIGAILDINVQATHKEAREGDIKDSLADISRAKELLGYAPDYDLQSGLKETIEWFQHRNFQ